ncbi:MAG: phosphoribosyl transferase [Patescibacteria group bacterium]|nr:phosphoribosyl transferase [Patescibacteria group bacterium]
MYFKDRAEAGDKLVDFLVKYRNQAVIVYGLPRGGVATGAQIAKRLTAPLDLVIARKIGHPENPEYGICAVAENGDRVCNEAEVAFVNKSWLEEETERQRQEAKRRRLIYLSGREPLSVKGKTAIIVDDGIATGLTIRAAIKELKHRKPKKIVVAAPVAPKDTVLQLKSEVDEVVVLYAPVDFFGAIGDYYEYFPQLSDEEVVKIMESFK